MIMISPGLPSDHAPNVMLRRIDGLGMAKSASLHLATNVDKVHQAYMTMGITRAINYGGGMNGVGS